jgi:hypothetical protein
MPVRGQPVPEGFIEDPPIVIPIITTPIYTIPSDSQDIAIPTRPGSGSRGDSPTRTPVPVPVSDPAITPGGPHTSTSADVSILPGSSIPIVGAVIDALSKQSFPWGLLALTVGGYFLLTSDLLKGGRKR